LVTCCQLPGVRVELGAQRLGGLGVFFFELLDVVDDVTDGAQTGEVLVGDLHAVLVLGLHGDLHHRQRVDVQVVDERLLRGDLRGLDTGDLFDDLGDTGDDFFLADGHDVFPFVMCCVLLT
jgi:hypothetical protein